MTYKRILVAVDGSKTSDIVFIEALHLAKLLQSALCSVYVIDTFPLYNLGMGIDFDRYREIARNNGLAILEKTKQVAEKNKGQTDTALLEIMNAEKKVSEKLAEAVMSYHADLIIIGTHGRRGFNRLILGSVAEETLRIAPAPVLIIRAEDGTADYYLQKKDFSYKRIIVAVDGSEASDLALNQAIYLAKTLQASLCILHVADEYPTKYFYFAKDLIPYQDSIRKHGQDILEKAKKSCQDNSLLAETLLIEINNKSEFVAEKIIATIQSLKADLLVIGTRGRTGMNRFLLGSIAEETIRQAPIPVLVVRSKEIG